MSRLLRVLPLALLAGSGAALAATSDKPAGSITEALQQGDTSLTFRLRHERVDDDAFTRDGEATTLRTRLGYTSANWNGLDLQLELDHIGQLLEERFNDTRNGNTTFPTVADPKGADLNQAALRYRYGAHSAIAGRQRITYDNHRFIGSVGWRQNEQTYDALRLTGKPLDSVQLDYAWISTTRRIFGPDTGTPPARLTGNHQLLNAKWSADPRLNLGGYFYSLDFDQAAALSSQTAGGFINGKLALSRVTLDYRVEAARQTDHASNPVDFDADYSLFELGFTVAGVRLGVAQETLGADGGAGVAMQTPLATLHAFQGWTDKFLSTPASGIEDSWISLGGKLAGIKLLAVWHQYDSDRGSADLGEELNLLASRQFAGRYTLTAKYADYDADSFSTDTRKFWLMAEASF